jgi:hypothetical protein
MKKQVQLFLINDDEAALLDAIRAKRPRVVVVDGSRWATRDPPVALSIASCASPSVFLWDQGIVERLPVGPRGDVEFEGPRTGVVVEVTRTRHIGNVLLSGRLAVSTGVGDKPVSAAMNAFTADVWAAMRKITAPVVAIDRESGAVTRERVTEYRAGHHAVAWANAAADHLFRDRSVLQVFFKPARSSAVRDRHGGLPSI